MIAKYRNRALLGIIPGLLIITFGYYMGTKRVDWFPTPDDRRVVALLTALCGYITLVAGCRSLARAKGWNDAVAFLPLASFILGCVPACRPVRSVVAPFIQWGNVLLPIVIVGVLIALPDKTRIPTGRRRRRYEK
jgi:O-antigen ligase